jgi:hypothetical protein
MFKHLTVTTALLSVSFGALGQSAADDANKSNNPLNVAASFNIQNLFAPSLFGVGSHTNDFLLRPTVPVAANSLIPVPEIFRLTVPISTRPAPSGGYNTGLGDTNLFDIFLLHGGDTQIGVGPLVTLPTATDRTLGSGKWQAGLAAVQQATAARSAGSVAAFVRWPERPSFRAVVDDTALHYLEFARRLVPPLNGHLDLRPAAWRLLHPGRAGRRKSVERRHDNLQPIRRTTVFVSRTRETFPSGRFTPAST